MRKLFLFICCVVTISCSTKRPKEILAPEKFSAIIREMGEAEIFVTNYVMKDTTKKNKEETFKLYQQIFSIHKTNSEQVLKSFDYYLQNPTTLKTMLDTIQQQSRKLQMNTIKKYKNE